MSDPKVAPLSTTILKEIRHRWSPRAFLDKPVPTDQLRLLLEAASWAPSSYNDQPWRFILGLRDLSPEVYSRIASCLVEANQQWVAMGPAPVLGLVVAKETSDRTGQPNPYHLYDCGQAMSSLSLQATLQDLYVHQMGGFDRKKAIETFELPQGYVPAAAFCLGYLGTPAILPTGGLREAEEAARKRHALEDLVFDTHFGTKASWL